MTPEHRWADGFSLKLSLPRESGEGKILCVVLFLFCAAKRKKNQKEKSSSLQRFLEATNRQPEFAELAALRHGQILYGRLRPASSLMRHRGIVS
jgi:hypothetical protein